jgi:uncharacterized membrane protein YidH (DUF202 family)
MVAGVCVIRASEADGNGSDRAMNRKLLLTIVVVLGVGVAVLGYLYYQEQQSGVEIRINSDGVSVDGQQ